MLESTFWRLTTRKFDELHPSVQAERVVAKAISDVIHSKTEEWTTWLS